MRTAAKRSTTNGDEPFPERDRREVFHHGGRPPGPRTGLPLSATPRRASSQSLFEDRREALHHGGRRAVPGGKPPRSASPRMASNVSPKRNRREALYHAGRRAGPRKGTAAKRSTAEVVEPVPGMEPPRNAPPRRASSRSAEGDRREALHPEGRRTCSRKGTAAKRYSAEGVEPVPGREPPRSAPLRRALNRFPEGDRRKALHHGRSRANLQKGTAAKRSTTKVVEPVP